MDFSKRDRIPVFRTPGIGVFFALILAAAFWSVRAFAAEWMFSPSLNLAEEYNSNVLFTPTDEKGDFRTLVNPVLAVTGKSVQTQFGFESSVSAEKYINNPSLDDIETANKALLRHIWTPASTTDLTATFARDATLESQLFLGGIAAQRVERYLFNVGVLEKYLLSETINLTVGANGGEIIYPDGFYPDVQQWQAVFEPAWKFDPYNSIGLTSSFAVADYLELSTLRILSELLYWERNWSETTSTKIGAGYRFTWTEGSAELDASGRPLPADQRDINTFSDGLIYTASLRKNWTERFTTTLVIGRDEFNTPDTRTFDHDFFRSTTTYRLSETKTLILDAGYDHNAQTGQGGNEKTDYIRIGPGLNWQFRPNTFLKLGASYEHLTSSTAVDDLPTERFRTWLSISWQWPALLKKP